MPLTNHLIRDTRAIYVQVIVKDDGFVASQSPSLGHWLQTLVKLVSVCTNGGIILV